MRVGLIGLGRMGEGMSRRMMKEGIEVYGYRRNFAKNTRGRKNVGLLLRLQLLFKTWFI